MEEALASMTPEELQQLQQQAQQAQTTEPDKTPAAPVTTPTFDDNTKAEAEEQEMENMSPEQKKKHFEAVRNEGLIVAK